MSRGSRFTGRGPLGVCFLFILLPLDPSSPQAGSIFPNPIVNLGSQAASLVSADLNGDGRVDLVAGEGGRIEIRQGLPQGQLGAPQVLDSPGGSVFTVAAGDFNGDGIPDLAQVARGFPDGVNVFLGRGGGRFDAALFTAIGGFQDDSLAIGDFNGDGRDDLAVGSNTVKSIYVALSLGDGTFGPASIVSSETAVTAMAVADFNGDGHDDLAAADNLANWPDPPTLPGLVRVFPGLGDGTFGPDASTGVGIFPMGLAVADFNADGHPDLGVANYLSGNASILQGVGDGTLAPLAPVPAGAAVSAVSAADLDGDDRIDLALGAIDVLTARGRGDGTFEAPVSSPSWGNATDLAVGDFDGDFRPDVAALNSITSVALLFSNGDGTFGEPAHRVPIGGANRLDLNTADFNHDGIPDLAGFYVNPGVPAGIDLRSDLVDGDVDPAPEIMPAPNRVNVRLGLGNGEFDPVPRVTPVSTSGSLLPGSVGDFNRDGEPDLVLIGGGATILLGKGDGTFDTGGPFDTGGAGLAVAVADWDGDSILDLAVLSSFPEFSFVTLKGVGDGTFGPPVTFPLTFLPQFLGMTMGDFDSDGAVDLAIVPNVPPPPFNPQFPPPLANVYVAMGNGDGTFETPAPFPAAVVPLTPVAADFNGDGFADLAVPDVYTVSGQSRSRGVGILISQGDGTFLPVSWVFVNPAPGTLAAADFDGDGKQDLAVGKSQGWLDVNLLIGRGDGSFRPGLGFGGTLTIGTMVTADLNLDGRTDLAVSDNSLGPAAASILLNRLPGVEHAPDAEAVGGSGGCGGGGGTGLDGSGSVDIDSPPGTNDDIVGFQWFDLIDPLNAIFLGSGEEASVPLSPGTHRLRLVVTDRFGETDAEEFFLEPGLDTGPPKITVSVSQAVLFPHNHKLIPIHATVLTEDECGEVTVTLESIVSSEPDDAPGGQDGSTVGDIQGAEEGTADFDFLLRAELVANGPGRAYRITYRAVDGSGNVSEGEATVLVPSTPVSAFRTTAAKSAGGSHPRSVRRPPPPLRPD